MGRSRDVAAVPNMDIARCAVKLRGDVTDRPGGRAMAFGP